MVARHGVDTRGEGQSPDMVASPALVSRRGFPWGGSALLPR